MTTVASERDTEIIRRHVTARTRGHLIYWDDYAWRYADDSSLVWDKERPCVRCNQMPTPAGYDACLGYVKGSEAACCGHGIQQSYGFEGADR